jgi:hypothetical protein
MSGWDLFQIATTLSMLGAHDQKVSVTFCDDEEEGEGEEDEEEEAAVAAGDDDEPPDGEQPAAASAASAKLAIMMARTRSLLSRGERITAVWPPSEGFMAPPGGERTYQSIRWSWPPAGEQQVAFRL